MTTGKFYGIGVGPGDPELITLKAIRVLEHCNVIAAPRTRGGGMRALDIAGQAVSLQDKTILPLSFAMSSDRALLREQYQRNAELIRAYLEKGEDTAMICIGDVSVFSTVCQIADVLKEMGCQTCLVPGISSYSAIAARMGISLTEGSRPFHVLPVSDVDLEQALSLEGTKVLMKAGSKMPAVLDLLKKRDLMSVSSLAVSCGCPDEKIMERLDKESDLSPEDSYMSTVIVRDRIPDSGRPAR